RRAARFPLAVLNLSAALDGKYDSTIIDGNIDRDFVSTAVRLVQGRKVAAVGVSVMGGPQLRTAIAVSKARRAVAPGTPIVWGGHFPTICAEAALNSPYVDYAVRGQGEDTFGELLDAHLAGNDTGRLAEIAGLSWKVDDRVIHNRNRPFSAAALARSVPYERVGDPRHYFTRTFLGNRTTGHQAALGCRF